MSDINDGVLREVNMFKVLKLFEEGREDIKSFFLKSDKKIR